MGSRRDLWPSGGPSERPGGLGIDFWLILVTILGPIWEVKCIKIIKKINLEWFKELKIIGHALEWLPTSIFSWFWSHFGVFLRWFFECFLNVVTTCTLTSFFKYFLMIFWLRRYSKILKIYWKTGVILNIRILHSLDTMIWKGIENSSRDSAKINENLSQNETQNAFER